MWAEVLLATGRRKDQFKFRDLFADERCSQAILDFLSTTDVGRRVDLERVVEDAQSELSEAELQERKLREEAKRLEADEQRGVGLIVRYIAPSGSQGGGQREL